MLEDWQWLIGPSKLPILLAAADGMPLSKMRMTARFIFVCTWRHVGQLHPVAGSLGAKIFSHVSANIEFVVNRGLPLIDAFADH